MAFSGPVRFRFEKVAGSAVDVDWSVASPAGCSFELLAKLVPLPALAVPEMGVGVDSVLVELFWLSPELPPQPANPPIATTLPAASSWRRVTRLDFSFSGRSLFSRRSADSSGIPDLQNGPTKNILLIICKTRLFTWEILMR